jgi:hypothetical protein
MVEFVGSGVVEIFPFEVDLRPADGLTESFGMVDGSGAALVVPADAAQFVEEVVGFSQLQVGFGDSFELLDELGRQEGSSIFAKISLLVGLGFQILMLHGSFLLLFPNVENSIPNSLKGR